jgi:hypothetical protein
MSSMKTDYSLIGSTVEVRYEPEWVGQAHRKLPLYIDGTHVGDAEFVHLHDNAIKRRPQEKTTAKPRSEDEPEEQSSQVSYTRAVKRFDPRIMENSCLMLQIPHDCRYIKQPSLAV